MASPTEHVTLGKIQGKANGEVTQFLGVKYAHLENQFAAPVLVEYSANGTTDATEIGYVLSLYDCLIAILKQYIDPRFWDHLEP